MSFAHPLWLAAGILIAVAFAVAAARAQRRVRTATIAYSNLPFLADAIGARFDPAVPIAAATVLALLGLGVSLAGPRVTLDVPAHGAVVVCIDTSGSMRATDVVPSRADAAAAAVRTFIDAVPDGTAIGMVAFAGSADVIAAATPDKDALRDAVSRLPPPNGGTAIGDALATAARLLPAGGRRAIVLITDGVNNAGADPLEVARQLGARGVEIDAIGIGTNGSGQLIPGTGEAASIDEDALREMASAGRGAYTRAADADSLRDRMAALARSTTTERRPVDLSLAFALGAGVLLACAAAAGMLAGRFP